MAKWFKTVVEKYLNVGTPLVLMGAMWLYLWAFPWRAAYFGDPRWGHNYAESMAFLAVGLATFNGRLVSDWISLLSALLIVPVSLELWPVPVTAILAAVLAVLIIVDMIVERGREDDLLQPSNRRLTFWLKRHLLRFAFFMLGHLALIYYFVRLPSGTYEDELVTKVYDAMLIVFMILAMLEGSVKQLWSIPTQYLSFFWGMLMTVVSLILLFWQPETRILLVITLAATAVGIVALIRNRQAIAAEASEA
ncbi:MAG: hypothetical protein JSV36_01310 [Anaerolineae bacterium]|nr:MAG: hypothetical protein JSV36_01310 [Anaerolineae bacterium]